MRLFLSALVVLALIGAAPAFVQAQGLASGKVGVFGSATTGYGFSAYSGVWTQTELDSPAEVCKASEDIGYLRTSGRIYAYNPTSDHWYSSPFTGEPVAQSVVGATALFWSSTSAYAIASIWSLWRAVDFQPGEVPRGGSAAPGFGMVWTMHTAYAFASGSGQWHSCALDGTPIGGVACSGFGLIWTPHAAYAFNPLTGTWSSQNLQSTSGVSADAFGNVGLIWFSNQAFVYSATADVWQSFTFPEQIWSGQAKGDVAIVWDSGRVLCYDTEANTWTMQVLPPPPEGVVSVHSAQGDLSFSVDPNPSDGAVAFHLPNEGKWEIDVIRVDGSLARHLSLNTLPGDARFVWDGRDGGGNPLPAGSYWVRAESEGHVEARRIVLVH
jgi:hypothetical protein